MNVRKTYTSLLTADLAAAERRRLKGLGIIAAVCALMVGAAAAQTLREENWERCEARTPQRRIEGCTAVIRAGGEANALLAIAHYNRALAYGDIGQHIQAIEDLDRVILLEPAHADAFNNRGFAWFTKGEYARAIRDYDEAIKLVPRRTMVLDNRGLAHLKVGHLDAAIADYSLSMVEDPLSAVAYYGRGLAHQRKGESERAENFFSLARKFDADIAQEFEKHGLR